MEIVGIDPAPGKDSTIYDGKDFLSKEGSDLISYIKKLKQDKNVLICWDAPLTGPGLKFNGSYSDRPIEKALRKH